MSYPKKDEFFGHLHSASETLKLAEKGIEMLWSEGEVRLKDNDISRINGYISLVESLVKEVEGFKSKFISIKS